MTLRFPFDGAPATGELLQVLPGIKWASMALPFALDHVNVWILQNDSSTTVIDTSIDTQKTRKHWQQLLQQCAIQPDRLLVTHYHPDHAGLAGWFADEWQCEVIFSASDYRQGIQAWTTSDEDVAANAAQWYSRNGLDQTRVESMAAAGNTYRSLVSELPASVTILSEGESFSAGPEDSWQVMVGRGHAPEMLCLYSHRLNVLIAADQVLPRITPNVSLNWYLQDDNPLDSFIQTLDNFAALPADTLVLPSHGQPFYGLRERVAELQSHHQQRFDSLAEFCRSPQTAASCLPHLFRRELDAQQLMFGMGESMAHLRYLHRAGRVELISNKGVDSYITAS